MDGSTAANFFTAEEDPARHIFRAVCAAVEPLGPVELRAGKTQLSFWRRHSFAAVWLPARVLGRGAPLVLTIFLRRRDPSPRWKQVVEPYPGRFTHHLELFTPAEVDDEVRGWLRAAWECAG